MAVFPTARLPPAGLVAIAASIGRVAPTGVLLGVRGHIVLGNGGGSPRNERLRLPGNEDAISGGQKRVILKFRFTFFDINFATIDGGHSNVFDKIDSNCFVLEGDKPKPARLARVDVFEDHRIKDVPKLTEVSPQLLRGQLEVKPSDKNLLLWIFKS